MAELSEVSSTIDESKIVTFPNSAYKLYQPFAPAGDQPTA
jgi:excinuclease ABC subunit B